MPDINRTIIWSYFNLTRLHIALQFALIVFMTTVIFIFCKKTVRGVETDKQETDLTFRGKGVKKNIWRNCNCIYHWLETAKRENARWKEYHDYSDRNYRNQDSRPNDTPQNFDDTASCSPCSFIRFNGAFAGRPVTPRWVSNEPSLVTKTVFYNTSVTRLVLSN